MSSDMFETFILLSGILLSGIVASTKLLEISYERYKRRKLQMANAKKCDRCGEFYSSAATPDISLIEYKHGYGEFRMDLCSQCQDELEKARAEYQAVKGLN